MSANSASNWIIIGSCLCTAAMLVWLMVPLLTSTDAAIQIVVRSELLSNLQPDYGQSAEARSFVSLRLAIVRDFVGSPDALEHALLKPVPTATWTDFDAASPYTLTPAETLTPTATPTAPISPTPTPTLAAVQMTTEIPQAQQPPIELPAISPGASGLASR